jgi:hypothetical protein
MSPPTTAILAWGMAAVALAATCGEVALGLLDPAGLPLIDAEGSAWIDNLELIFFPLVGALIAWKRPTNVVGWLLLTYSLAEAFHGLAGSYAERGVLTEPDSLPGAGGAAWVITWSWTLVVSLIPLTLLHFPNGRLPSPGWRWARWLCALPVVLMAGPAAAWLGRPARQYWGIEDGALLGAEWVGPLLTAMFAALILCLLVSLVSLVMRYRRAQERERQQLKWIMLAVGALLIQGVWEIFLPGPADLKAAAGAVAFAAIPVSMGIAILRYRLYDIDRIINRAIVYALVTGSAVAVYAGTVFVVGTVVVGPSDNLTVAVATLAAAAVFRPALRWVQAFVDRRFYRRKYDAQHTIDSFGARLREETDLDELTDDLVGVVRTTMQPQHVSVWLKAQEAER